MNLLIVMLASVAAALVSAWAAQKAKYWLNSNGVQGGHASFLASAMSMSIPLLILLFGNHLIPADLTIWPAIIAAGCAIRAAIRQKDGVDPAVKRRETLARLGIVE